MNDALEDTVSFELAVNLSTPVNVDATIVSDNQINVTWSSVDKANSYIIYRNGNFLYSGSGIGYFDRTTVQGETYVYKVKAANGSYTSSFSTEASVIIPFPDSDGDGTLDDVDECSDDPNKLTPGQCGCGVADTGLDDDGVADCLNTHLIAPMNFKLKFK